MSTPAERIAGYISLAYIALDLGDDKLAVSRYRQIEAILSTCAVLLDDNLAGRIETLREVVEELEIS